MVLYMAQMQHSVTKLIEVDGLICLTLQTSIEFFFLSLCLNLPSSRHLSSFIIYIYISLFLSFFFSISLSLCLSLYLSICLSFFVSFFPSDFASNWCTVFCLFLQLINEEYLIFYSWHYCFFLNVKHIISYRC